MIVHPGTCVRQGGSVESFQEQLSVGTGVRGFSLDMICLDSLHTVDLGVSRVFVGLCCHVLIESKVALPFQIVQVF